MALGLIVKRAGLCTVLMLVVSASVSAQPWVSVATAGLDDPTQREVSALAVFGSEVYLATHNPAGVPRIFRAPIRDDDSWEEVTPPGLAGEVTSMVVVGGELLVSTMTGQLRSRDRAGVWIPITPSPPGWGAPRPILDVTGWTPRRGGRILCVARLGLEVWCKDNLLPWALLPLPGSLGTDAGIGSATLQVYEDRLYLGFGGLADGSRSCEAWKYDFGPRRWQAVSMDCFGQPNLTWMLSMGVFRGRLYFGTGGALAKTVMVRTDGRTLEEVTPCDLYDGCSITRPGPVRYQAFASAGSQFFVGVREGVLASGSGYVLSTGNGTNWGFGSPRGFGVACNDVVTTLGSSRAYLYAGTFNGCTGFEVWRRTPSLSELYPYLINDTFDFLRRALVIRACLFSPRACDLAPAMEPIEAMSVAFDAAQDPKDDQSIIMRGRDGLSEATSLLVQTQKLLDAAAHIQDAKGARELRRQAATRLADAMQLVWMTVVWVGDQLPSLGQQPPPPSDNPGGPAAN